MSVSRAIRDLILSSGCLCALAGVYSYGSDANQASIEDINGLFKLATVGPQKMRVVAEIVITEPKWSEDQIANEL